eukprot:CAMPEP_0185758708 /NCGR_PEP_ID=MMETSP1174-20130828/17380_1 /TAXON_ID=35687 /ORGANISM="Dictyocha speculum, Strain CCMP1381" /LENGTH=69 /DNA_ID=CAMNT_0028438683 /DNA_START=20 /DNA_END=229 /DNA_ORIENTATION=+
MKISQKNPAADSDPGSERTGATSPINVPDEDDDGTNAGNSQSAAAILEQAAAACARPRKPKKYTLKDKS